ncbi:S41 family peptidase [Flavobacterium algicola]|nr:S41 family peptidase [Flavobacterium algicola]
MNQIAAKVKNHYIFKDIAIQTDSLLRQKNIQDKFALLDNKDFAKQLTTYLKSVTKDKHFFIKYIGNTQVNSKVPNDKEQQKIYNYLNSLENYGFESVKRLEGNIGYINYKGFAEPKSSEIAMAAAMNFVANTNSLIIDLRENKGGDGNTLLQFCSYFFKVKTKLYDTYFRNTDHSTEDWTKNKVLGLKYLNKPIYILTSGTTFSAGEGLSYFLQSYNLAKVIGEQTGGAANPVDHFIIDNQFLVLIPSGKITATLTKNSWEQLGVTPDIIVSKEKAFTNTYCMALNELLKNSSKTELKEEEIRELIKSLEKDL